MLLNGTGMFRFLLKAGSIPQLSYLIIRWALLLPACLAGYFIANLQHIFITVFPHIVQTRQTSEQLALKRDTI